MQVIAENLSEEEIAGLKEMFKMMDTDNSGQINFEELKAGLLRVGAKMKEPEIYQLMQAVSLFCFSSTYYYKAWKMRVRTRGHETQLLPVILLGNYIV